MINDFNLRGNNASTRGTAGATRGNSAADKHVQKVLLWRENFAIMSDSIFFELMRMYLGEIKTPFNKQKLIETIADMVKNPTQF